MRIAQEYMPPPPPRLADLPEALRLYLEDARPPTDAERSAIEGLAGWWWADGGAPSPALLVPTGGAVWFARSDAPPGTPPSPGWYLHAGLLWPATQAGAIYLRGWLYNQPGWAQGHDIYVEFRLEGEGHLLMTRSLFCKPGGPFKFGFQDGHFRQAAPGADPWDRGEDR
ncbi:MAG: hypothetical protein R3F60_29465 [bacterium]